MRASSTSVICACALHIQYWTIANFNLERTSDVSWATTDDVGCSPPPEHLSWFVTHARTGTLRAYEQHHTDLVVMFVFILQRLVTAQTHRYNIRWRQRQVKKAWEDHQKEKKRETSTPLRPTLTAAAPLMCILALVSDSYPLCDVRHYRSVKRYR